MGQRVFEVTEAVSETNGVMRVHLRPVDGGMLLGYRPGQHITITDPVIDVARGYSLTGPALPDQATYRIAIRHVPGGRFSTRVHEEFRSGTRVGVTAPGGLFVIPTESPLPVVPVAAGSGITPFMSYLETLSDLVLDA